MGKRPIDVLLAVPVPPPFSGPEIVGRLLLTAGLGPDFRVHHLSTSVNSSNTSKGKLSFANLVGVVGLWFRLLAALLRYRPRLVYMYLSQNKTGFLRDTVVILTAWACRATVVAHIHGSNFGNFYQHAGPRFRQFVRFVVQRLTRVILLAERLRSQFNGLLPPQDVSVLYNAVDHQFLDRLVNDRPKADSVFTVLFMGHLSQAKGFVDVLSAAPKVLDAVSEAVFVFAGEWLADEKNILFDEHGRQLRPGSASTDVSWKALRERYGERVRYLGVVGDEKKVETFQAADVLVLPSYSEGLPMVVLEAMAAHLPVVVTPVGALPEILQEGIHARFVQPGDTAALTQALLDLACRPEERLRMGQANRALVEQMFTPDVLSTQLAEVFKECLTQA